MCQFCKSNETRNVLLGELRYSDVHPAVHKFCLYFSPNLPQNTSRNDYFWGFRSEDIVIELERGKSLKCSFCKKMGALVECFDSKCNVKFHLSCGIQKGTFHNYNPKDGIFSSFCPKHKPKKILPSITEPVLCTICREYMDNSDQPQILSTECCRNIFHIECLTNYADNYFGKIRCPNCKNTEVFPISLKRANINYDKDQA